MNINKINPLNPFGRMCVSLGMLPSSYKESMTYEEQLLWLFNYLDKTLIPKINEQDETINGVIDLFNQLKEYVDNYFENLDVQDEINHKLDEMVEDGTFDVIFAQVDAKIGDLSSLTTTDTSSIVSAVNEIDKHTDTNTSAIGDLSSLTTTSKTNLVSAINEVDRKCDTNTSNISTNSSAIGTLSNLSTTEKSNLVGAINEVVTRSTNAVSKLGQISYVSYDSITPTSNYTLESDVNSIQLTLNHTEILDSLSGQIALKNTFALTGGTAKLLVTLNQPSGRTFQGGHCLGLLSNGEACELTILGGTNIKIYAKSPNTHSAGTITAIYIANYIEFNTEKSVSF